jgi:glycyl-tRNA synthetase
VARQFIFRMREFEQMEMQFFVRPGTQKEWYEHWKAERLQWHTAVMGFPAERLKFHNHIKLAHYADAALDIEFEFPFGFKELEGIHSRTDFDLGRHQEFSKKKQQYFDAELNQNYVPYVVETSVGLDRLVLATLSNAYAEESWAKEDGSPDSRVVLRLPANLAPVKLAVLPLTKKEGLPDLARQLMDSCKTAFHCFYEEKDTIGKRYRRMDALGTPFCVTIDHQTKEDQTVTIRHRDSMTQERILLADVKSKVLAAITV